MNEERYHKLTKNLPHYLPLIGVFLASILALYIFSYDQMFQLAISASLAVSYVVWGVIHHYIHKDLCIEIIFEYLGVAFLGFVVMLSLILRS